MARRDYHFQQNPQVEPVEVIMAVRWKDGTIRCFQGRATDVYHGPVPHEENPLGLRFGPHERDPEKVYRSTIDWMPGEMVIRHQPGVERWGWQDAEAEVVERAEITEGQKLIEPRSFRPVNITGDAAWDWWRNGRPATPCPLCGHERGEHVGRTLTEGTCEKGMQADRPCGCQGPAL